MIKPSPPPVFLIVSVWRVSIQERTFSGLENLLEIF